MEVLSIHRRVERTIRECRALGIEPSPRTVAEIMIDGDVTIGRFEDSSSERKAAFVEYERAAARALARLSVVPPSSNRRSA